MWAMQLIWRNDMSDGSLHSIDGRKTIAEFIIGIQFNYEKYAILCFLLEVV